MLLRVVSLYLDCKLTVVKHLISKIASCLTIDVKHLISVLQFQEYKLKNKSVRLKSIRRIQPDSLTPNTVAGNGLKVSLDRIIYTQVYYQSLSHTISDF